MTHQWPDHMMDEIRKDIEGLARYTETSTEYEDGGDATGRQEFSDRRFKTGAEQDEDRKLKSLRDREGNKSWKKKVRYPTTRTGRRLWKIRKIIEGGITPD